MNVDRSKFEYAHELMMEGKAFHVRSMIPYAEKERMAQECVNISVVLDDELGIAYEAYNAEMLRAFLILVYYTDLDLEELDTPEGRQTAYDAIASHGLWQEIMAIVDEDMADVDNMCMRLDSAVRKRFNRKYSLEYRLEKTFGSLLGTEDLMQTVAKAEGLNSKLIDMLGAFQKEQNHSELGNIRLAKKQED